MPVSSPLTPKSVLRHRPLDSFEGTPKTRPTVTRASRPTHKTKEIVPPLVCSPAQQIVLKKRRSRLNLTSLGIGMMVPPTICPAWATSDWMVQHHLG